jgi:hypothetical protein
MLAVQRPRRILVLLPDDGPVRPKHVAGNKYSIVKYRLIIYHFVVATATLTIRKCYVIMDIWCGYLLRREMLLALNLSINIRINSI